MKILMINVVCGIRSTGRICTDLALALEEQDHEVKIACGRELVPKQFEKYFIRIGNNIDVILHGLRARVFDESGFGSKQSTKEFIEWVKIYNPDVIHIHNIHGYYINIKILFDYLRNCNKKIIWTLHDCWSFTGHCAYFEYIGCNKWKTGCERCPQGKEYPKSLFIDRSRENYKRKKKLFTSIPNLTLVTPSKWLADLVQNSFLAEYPVTIIHNGIDLKVFKVIQSDLKEKYGIQGKKIILGVAAVWDRRKGLNSFIELAKIIDDKYQIILVGLTNAQIKELPKNIIGIEQVDNVKELAMLYSAADFFVNPTLEDNYPTTNLEAIACNTPVITYDTGGSGESASIYGTSVKKNDVVALYEIIETNEFARGDASIDISATLNLYLKLYSKDF